MKAHLVAIMLALPGAVAYPQTARVVAQRAFPSVVLLMMEDRNGQPIALGSGFAVANGVVATNMHVIAEASGGYAKLVGQPQRLKLTGILGRDARHDLALLSIDGLNAPALEVGDSGAVTVGDDVFVVGNPRGLEGTLSTGIISGIRSVGQDKLLQITAPISPGSSGGPVLDGRGRVIGISVAALTNGENLNFAVPSAYLAALLSDRRSQPVGFDQKPVKTRSIVDEFGGGPDQAIQITKMKLTECNRLHFSLVNKLDRPVNNVVVLYIVKDEDRVPIDSATVTYRETILPGLAKRFDNQPTGYSFDYDIVRSFFVPPNDLVAEEQWQHQVCTAQGITPTEQELGFVEMRVLTFDVLEQ